LGNCHFQRDVPSGRIEIPKAGESWVVTVQTDRESANKDVSRAKPLKATPRRALVIEKEPAMCALMQEVLESAELEVVTPAKGIENQLHFDEEKFDVALIGLGTPSENGMELVRQIRKSSFNRKTPIIMISDDLRPAALTEGFKAGASFFVYKPIDRAHLMRLIRVTQGTIEHEKRRFRRIAVRARVRVKCGDKSVEGETIDISLNGALIQASHTFPVGSPVEVNLYLLAGKPPIAGLGSIMRLVEGNQMGIQLERLPAAESGRLQEYLLPLTTG